MVSSGKSLQEKLYEPVQHTHSLAVNPLDIKLLDSHVVCLMIHLIQTLASHLQLHVCVCNVVIAFSAIFDLLHIIL